MSSDLEAVERPVRGAQFARRPPRSTLPARFSDLPSEWSAVRQRCGLLDARFRGLLRLTGSDRVSFLQGMVTNDVARLQDGEGTYAALLTQQGKIVSDLRVYVLADELWLDVPAASRRGGARGAGAFHHCRRRRVRRRRRRGRRWWPSKDRRRRGCCWRWPGESMERRAAVCASRAALRRDAAARRRRESQRRERLPALRRPRAVASKLWEHCHAAGAEPVGMEALDVLRVEAGIPWYGRDMDESMLVSEVGHRRARSATRRAATSARKSSSASRRAARCTASWWACCATATQVPPPDAKLMADGKEVGLDHQRGVVAGPRRR